MIKSPGVAASTTDWIVRPACSMVGALPPIVSVIASIDDLPLPAVITTSPHCAGGWPLCWTAQLGTPVGTSTVIDVSLQLVTGALTPPIVTDEIAAQLPPTEVHWLPKP